MTFTIILYQIKKQNIEFLNLDNAIYIHGTLKIYHVERITETNLDFYLNSPYNHEAVKHHSITFQSNKPSSMAKQPSSQSTDPPATRQPSEAVSADQAVSYGLIELPQDFLSISQWVKVLYEGGVLLKNQNNPALVWYLSKPFGITVPKNLERKNDVVYYEHVPHRKVTPMLSPVNCSWKYT